MRIREDTVGLPKAQRTGLVSLVIWIIITGTFFVVFFLYLSTFPNSVLYKYLSKINENLLGFVIKDHYIVTLSDNYGHVLGYYICQNIGMKALENKLTNIISKALNSSSKTRPVKVYLSYLVFNINMAIANATMNTAYRLCRFPSFLYTNANVVNSYFYVSLLGKDSLTTIAYDSFSVSIIRSPKSDYYELFFLKLGNPQRSLLTYTITLKIYDVKFYIILSYDIMILLLYVFILGNYFMANQDVNVKYKYILTVLASYIAIVSVTNALKWYLSAYRGGLWFYDLVSLSMVLIVISTIVTMLFLMQLGVLHREIIEALILLIVILAFLIIYIVLINNIPVLLLSVSSIMGLKMSELAQVALIFAITLTLMPLALSSTEAQKAAYDILMNIAILALLAMNISTLYVVGASAGEFLGVIFAVAAYCLFLFALYLDSYLSSGFNR